MTSDIDSTTFVDTDDESYYHCPNRKYDDDEDGKLDAEQSLLNLDSVSKIQFLNDKVYYTHSIFNCKTLFIHFCCIP